MNEKEFWDIIKQMQSYDEPFEWLIEHLSKKTDDEIIDYEIHLKNALDKSYTSHLWGAGYLIMGGCSDDCFEYFRCWLIAQGQEIFELTLENPEFLAECIPDFYEEEEIVPELEDMLYIAMEAYSLKKTGDVDCDEASDEFLSRVEEREYECNRDNIEFDWEDEDDLMVLFPKLWDRFGENPLG
ncbi:protein of unknown function DUF4240 [Gottschalkia purinilytica]|uniref:DUF4240 domain-containing protein n=1 Tax=Gottschalkia purinilytica TaxID=1503 RepID=A0A0L0W9T0_GOTPU|nr:DUF4240 domain-containing protein [Gottschalkia purinilytica]KNF08313.1 protein of unknown function DUF4240 [Gottschalkia purinilytica]